MWAPVRWLSLCFPFTYYTDLIHRPDDARSTVVYSLSGFGIYGAVHAFAIARAAAIAQSLHGAEISWGGLDMKRLGRQLKSYRKPSVAVIRNEFRAIFTDEGALLILVFALFIYSTTYSLAYGPQVLRNVPIGVVDNSHTAASRRLTATFDAGPNAYVAHEPTDMEQARELFFQRRIYGVTYIPEKLRTAFVDGEQADAAIYVDAKVIF